MASKSSGRCSFATLWKTHPSRTISSKAHVCATRRTRSPVLAGAPLARRSGTESLTVPNSLKLVRPDGSLYDYVPSRAPLMPTPRGPFATRVAFAAAHVVVDPLRTADPLTHPTLDWDETLAYREYLWSLGFGVAEAMDTAQRGMASTGHSHSNSFAAAPPPPTPAALSSLAAPAPTTSPHPQPTPSTTSPAAYLHQCEAIEAAGGRIILMASRALAAIARHADDYAAVYSRVLSQNQAARHPALARPMFDPASRRLLGLPLHPRRHAELRCRHPRKRRQNRRHQDLASRRRSRSLHARATPSQHPHVHRR